MTQRPRLIVGISGASGAIFGVRTLEALRELDVESHLILSRAAEVTIAQETEWTVKDVHALADVVHAVEDIGAGPSSGSFRSLGMIVAPCSVRSLSEIAAGIASTLLTRAADVTLKERRDLDDVIARLLEAAPFDQLQLQRLKKRKLLLKDQIVVLDDKLTPDIIA